MAKNRRKQTTLGVAIVGVLIILATACGEAQVETNSNEGVLDDSATMQEPLTLRQQFEANPWRIVEQEGFKTTAPDGVMTFEEFGADAIITIELLPCGRWGGHPIEWNEEGFVLTESANTEGGVDTMDIGCGPGDDLFDLLARGIDPDQFVATVSEDQTTATLRKGEKLITLEVTTTVPPPETTVAPPAEAELDDLAPSAAQSLDEMLACTGEIAITDAAFGDVRSVATPLDVVERLLAENGNGDPSSVWAGLSPSAQTESGRAVVTELVNEAGEVIGLVESVPAAGGWDVGSSALCFE